MIRPAQTKDIPALVELGRLMHAESPRFSLLTFDAEKVRNLLTNAIANPAYFIVVADNLAGTDIKGGFVGFCMPHWFSQDSAAHDLALFIEPGKRGGMVAVKLLKSFIDWAKWQGAKQINLGISTGVMVEQTAELYRMLRLKQFGYLFEV